MKEKRKFSEQDLSVIKEPRTIEKKSKQEYIAAIKKACLLGKAYSDYDSQLAIQSYHQALMFFQDLITYLNETDIDQSQLLNSDDIKQRVDIYYNLYTLHSKNENFSELLAAKKYLELAISDYRSFINLDLTQIDQYRYDLELFENEMSKIEKKIDRLSEQMLAEKTIVDAIVLKTPINQSQPCRLYNFQHAGFVLKEIANCFLPDQLIINCENEEKLKDIYTWLEKLNTLQHTIVKLKLTVINDFKLMTNDKLSIFHLRQWQATTEKIGQALQNKNWLEIFNIINQQSHPQRRLIASKRLSLIKAYKERLQAIISEQDYESFISVYKKVKSVLKEKIGKTQKKDNNLVEENQNLNCLDLTESPPIISTTKESASESTLIQSKPPETPTQIKTIKSPWFFGHVPLNKPTSSFSESDLIKSIWDMVVKINKLERELGRPPLNLNTLIGWAPRTELHIRKNNCEKILNELESSFAKEKIDCLKEIKQAWCHILAAGKRLNLSLTELPKHRNLSELKTFSALKGEKERLKGELQQLQLLASPKPT